MIPRNKKIYIESIVFAALAAAAVMLWIRLLGAQEVVPENPHNQAIAHMHPACHGQTTDANPPAAPPSILIIGLTDKSITVTDLTSHAFFDHDGNNVAELTGWHGESDAVLAWDRNGDGEINNGHEVFGNYTLLKNGRRASSGFEALAEWDENHDGRIDVKDSVWIKLRAWQSDQANGWEYRLRLYPLETFKITSIELRDTGPVSGVKDGALHRLSYSRADGTRGVIEEHRLLRSTKTTIVHSEFAYEQEPPEIASLPDIEGQGEVRSLHQAMVRDTGGELKSLLQEFLKEQDPEKRTEIFERLLFRWTDADHVPIASRGPNMDARRVVVLERFYSNAPTCPGKNLAFAWEQTYSQIFENQYTRLLERSHLKDLYKRITCEPTTKSRSDVPCKIGAVITELRERFDKDTTKGRRDLSELARILRTIQKESLSPSYLVFRETFIEIDPSLGWEIDSGGLRIVTKPQNENGPIVGSDRREALRGGLGNGEIKAYGGNDVIYGSDRDEKLDGENGDDIIVGGGGNDLLMGWFDDDILDGGPGNDILKGEEGNDTYIFRRGSGQDTILQERARSDDNDRIFIGYGIVTPDVILSCEYDDLVLSVRGTMDKLTVKDWFNNKYASQIRSIEFMDGTIWGREQIVASLVKTLS